MTARFAFLYFGRPGKTKGVFLLLAALEKVKGLWPSNVRFVFILSREPRRERKRFERLVTKKKLENVVTILDSLDEMGLFRALDEAYCVVVPSITEGFGFSAAEACKRGRPIIASDAGSLPEVVSGKVIMFENRNIDDLGAKLIMGIDGNFSHIPEKTFDWDHSTAMLIGLYKKLVHASAGPTGSQ